MSPFVGFEKEYEVSEIRLGPAVLGFRIAGQHSIQIGHCHFAWATHLGSPAV